MNFPRRKALKLCLFIGLILAVPAFSQKLIDGETAELLLHRNYGSALPSIATQLEKSPDQPLLNYYAGLCYLHSRSQKPKAVAFLEKAVEHSHWWRNNGKPAPSEAPADVHKLLGDAYYYAFKFEAAVQAYEKYRSLNAGNKSDSLAREVEVKTGMCKYLKDFRPGLSLPLSARTGSPCADLVHGTMTTSLSTDKSMVTYVLKVPLDKHKKLPDDASYFEEMPLPPLKDSASQRQKEHEARKHIELDTVMYAATVGTSFDGQVMLTYKNEDGAGNVYISRLYGNRWSKPSRMRKSANPAGWETFETMSADGKYLYFASDRPGGYGGLDLYRCTMQPDGQWSKAVNLGPSVNTDADETAPFIHPDGATLFYSSNRNRPGSYDIFSTASLAAGSWETPQNVGFPVNRHEQDIFQVDAGKKRIYSSAPAGRKLPANDSTVLQGESIPLNLHNENYLITFTGEHGAPLHLRRGVIHDQAQETPLKAQIVLIDNTTGNELARYHTVSTSGEFAAVLPREKNLQLLYFAQGYLPQSENIDLSKDKNHFDVHLPVKLAPLAAGSSCTLNNVFFEEGKNIPSETSEYELDRIITLLKENPYMKAEISSVIWTPVNRKFYKRLSKERAKAVVAQLEKEGIKKKRVSADWEARKPVRKKEKEPEKKKSRIKKRNLTKKEDIKPIQQIIFTIREMDKE